MRQSTELPKCQVPFKRRPGLKHRQVQQARGKLLKEFFLYPETDLMRVITTYSDLLFWEIGSSSYSCALLGKFEVFAFMGSEYGNT